jgi:hypothetical protein
VSCVCRVCVSCAVKLGSINKNKPLEIYKDFFEGPFLEDTRDYYARESGAFISTNGVSSYMKKAKERLEEEAGRGKKYLDSSSFEKVPTPHATRHDTTRTLRKQANSPRVVCRVPCVAQTGMRHSVDRAPQGPHAGRVQDLPCRRQARRY